MIFVNHYTIRPSIPKTIFMKCCRVEIIAFSFLLFYRDRFFNFCCLVSSVISCCISVQTLSPATTCSYYSFYQVRQTWAYSWLLCSLHAGIRMSQDAMVCSCDGCRHSVADWLIVAFITWNSNSVPLLEGLCSSNPCRFEISNFGIFARIEPTTSELTVSRSDQLS